MGKGWGGSRRNLATPSDRTVIFSRRARCIIRYFTRAVTIIELEHGNSVRGQSASGQADKRWKELHCSTQRVGAGTPTACLNAEADG